MSELPRKSLEMLKETYQKKVVPKLKDEIAKGHALGVPTITKIVVNTGVGAERDQREALKKTREELALIVGQTPSFRLA